MGKRELNFGKTAAEKETLRIALEASYTKDRVAVGYYDNDGRLITDDREIPIGTSLYYMERKDNSIYIYGVYRTDIGRWIIEESVWRVDATSVKAMGGVGGFGEETIRWRSYVANAWEFSRIALSFPLITPQQYSAQVKRLALTIRETFEVGKIGRTYKPLPGDSIQFPETE